MPRTALSRRSLLGAAIAGTALGSTACDPLDGVTGSGYEPSDVPQPTAPAVDADVDIVSSVGEGLASTAATADAIAKAFPGLRPACRDFARLHRAHIARLATPSTGAAAVVASRRPAALKQLHDAEAVLQRQLVSAAEHAGSGSLARLFASMAAGVAQLRAVHG